jgi:hypothetical protein
MPCSIPCFDERLTSLLSCSGLIFLQSLCTTVGMSRLSVCGNTGGNIIRKTGYLRDKRKVLIYHHVLYRRSFPESVSGDRQSTNFPKCLTQVTYVVLGTGLLAATITCAETAPAGLNNGTKGQKNTRLISRENNDLSVKSLRRTPPCNKHLRSKLG